MKAWKERVVAFILSIVWWIFGFSAALGQAYLPRRHGVVFKILVFPIEVTLLISRTLKNIIGLQKSNFIEILGVITSIIVSTVILIIIYKVFRTLKEL